MPVQKGSMHIVGVKKGTNEIAKIYKGTSLVFNRDRAVWLVIRGAPGSTSSIVNSWWYSLDGKTYTNIGAVNAKWELGGVIDKKIVVWADYTAGNKILRLYDIDELKKSNLSFTTTQWSDKSIAPWSVATNGKNVIVLCPNQDGIKGPIYSLDSGLTWHTVDNGFTSSFEITYIGNNLFRLFRAATGSREFDIAGKYLYWNANNPSSVYQRNYYYTDNTQPTLKTWLSIQNYGIQCCNDGAVYVADTSTNTQFRGNYTKASAAVTLSDGSSNKWALRCITKVYDKYYGIIPGDASTDLYVSNDGINFTLLQNDNRAFFRSGRGGKVTAIDKCDGKLCFMGDACGIVNPDYTFELTTLDNPDYNSVSKGVSNKFNKTFKSGMIGGTTNV